MRIFSWESAFTQFNQQGCHCAPAPGTDGDDNDVPVTTTAINIGVLLSGRSILPPGCGLQAAGGHL